MYLHSKKRTGLKVHIKAQHTEEEFKCEKCDTAFSVIHNLNMHIEDNYTAHACDFTCHDLLRLWKQNTIPCKKNIESEILSFGFIL